MITLYPYQEEAIEFIKKAKKVYLAMGTGTGKTITSLIGATRISDDNILIIAELNEVENSKNFEKEVKNHIPEWGFYNLREINIKDVPEKKSICIINPDGLAKIKEYLL